ncbi:MAG: filamentous hemagglutinin family protein, partial [Pseudomonadota bacterium]
SAGKAGRIRAYAGGTLTVGSNANLLAISAKFGEAGGKIELGGVADVNVMSTAIGMDEVKPLFNVSGVGGAGSVLVRAPVVAGNNEISVSAFNANVVGADDIRFEAYRTFDESALANPLVSIKGQLDNVAPHIGDIEMRLTNASLPEVKLVLGAEVIGSGDIVLNNELDLINWRFAGDPGTLTIRTPGQITIDAIVSDGFEPDFNGTLFNPLNPRPSAITSESSSFRFVAGANTSSADPLALNRSIARDLVFKDGAVLRTGTGDIEIATSGNLTFEGDYGIYSAGTNRGSGAYLDDLFRELIVHGDFLENSGDVFISVAGDLKAENQTGYISDWLARGAIEIISGLANFPNIGTSWGVDFSLLKQGVGAFGGGDVDIRVGNDMQGVSVYLPSTALPTGDFGSQPEIVGGGDLSLVVGGDVVGGSYYLGAGVGLIEVGGSVSGGITNPLTFSVSDGIFNVRSQGNIAFDALQDPFLSPRSSRQGLIDFLSGDPFLVPRYEAFFASFSEGAAINLTSISGNVVLEQNLDAFESLSTDVNFEPADRPALQIIPPSLSASALSGSVLIGDTLSLFPSPEGSVDLFARQNVQRRVGATVASINLSDADLTLLPSVAEPLADLTLTRQLVLDAASHAVQPVRAGNTQANRIVALEGIAGSVDNADLIFDLGKRLRMFAGNGIRRFQLEAQHVNTDDVSVIFSAGDITYPLARNNSNALADSQVSSLTFAGPGRVDVIAAGDIDLGTSGGIRTVGDTLNSALADSSASVNVLEGIGENPDYNAFAETFFSATSGNQARLVNYLGSLGVSTSSDPIASYQNLNETQKRQFAIDVFFDELIASGVFATSSGTDDYSRGNEAIATLFPGQAYNGDLISLVSRIQTVDGGDINILVPGGDIIAGSSSEGFSNPAADRIGIVVQREGDLNIYVRDDLLVEISRVFTLDGGDIAIWSGTGDIDAGRGAKSALSIPGLVTTFDAEGNLVTEFPPAIQGSGIRAAVASPGRAPGDVFLFAPQGAVIAGDAGIGSAGNLTIGATEVVGADNIDVGGVSVGVPASDVGSVAAGLTGVSDSSAQAAQSAQDTAGDSLAGNEEAIGEALSQGALSFISVEVLGFGG